MTVALSETTTPPPMLLPALVSSPHPVSKTQNRARDNALLQSTLYRDTVELRFPDDDLQSLANENDIHQAGNRNLQQTAHSECAMPYVLKRSEQPGEEDDLSHTARSSETSNVPSYRCIICTLPGGTCKHTPAWVQYAFESKREDPVDAEFKRLTDVISSKPLTARTAFDASSPSFDAPCVSIRELQWVEPLVLPNDRSNGRPVNMSSPPPTGGHTCLIMDGRMYVLGGLTHHSATSCPLFHPYASYLRPRADYGSVTNRVAVFSFVDCIWSMAVTTGGSPPARMGHVAVVLADGKTAFVFGGVTDSGQCMNDAWLFHSREYRWEKVPESLPKPHPRYNAAAVLRPTGDHEVLMFGGRGLDCLLGDLWAWDPRRKLWSTPLSVGIPPAPRYGHAMVAVSGGRILVMGGCRVGPQHGNRMSAEECRLQAELRRASQRLSECYNREEQAARVLGYNIAAGASCMSWQGLAHAAAAAADAVLVREVETRKAEEGLLTLQKRHCIQDQWSMLASEQKAGTLEVVVLSTDNGAFIWSLPVEPPVSGHLPSGRISFMAHYVSTIDRVLLWGGCSPTTSQVLPTSDVYVLHLRSMRWSTPAIKHSHEVLDSRVQCAKMSVRQAKRNLETAQARAHHMGVPGARSVEVAHCEAALAVHRWRLNKLHEEQERAIPPPEARFGAGSILYGGRIYFFGGWTSSRALDDFIALDFEQPDEKERRLRDEMAVRLERERSALEFQQVIELKRAWYMELKRKKKEEAREVKERRAMAIEDMLSGMPPKTKGPKPTVKWVTAQTAWVTWEPVRCDAKGQPLSAGSVEYTLWMKGGCVSFVLGSEVLVEVVRPGQEYQQPRIYSDDVVSCYDLAYATIVRDHHDGLFDIKYKQEGYIESKVPRARLRPAKSPEWQPIYRGTDTTYDVVDLVPDYIMEREPTYQVLCSFALQTNGVDYPKGEPSLMGEVTVCCTKANTVSGPMRHEKNRRRAIESQNVTLYAWNGEYWSEGMGLQYT